MDPATLMLGILPICLTAMQGFSVLRRSFHTLRHTSKEVKLVRRKLRVQVSCFEDEIHLLLLEILDPRAALAMMGDKNHAQWDEKNSGLESKLVNHLGPRYRRFYDALQEIEQTIKEIRAKLMPFIDEHEEPTLHKSMKDAFRLLFNHREYEGYIGSLKESIAELRRIREVTEDVKKKLARAATRKCAVPDFFPVSENTSSPIPGLLPYCKGIRELSLGFHDCLRRNFTCNKAFHSRHLIRMMLPPGSPGMEQNKKLALLLEYAGDDGYDYHIGRRPFLVSRSCPARSLPSTVTPPTSPNDPSGYPLAALGETDQRPPKRQKTANESLCDKMATCSITTPNNCHPWTLSFHDIPGAQCFIFETASPHLEGMVNRDVTFVAELLNQSDYEVLSDRCRLKIALVLTKATLMHQSTPWWPEGYLLPNVGVFVEPKAELETCLDTLHVISEIGGSKIIADTDMLDDSESLNEDGRIGAADIVNCSEGVSEGVKRRLKYECGVRCFPLYSLGVALLQIGLWDCTISWVNQADVRRKTERLSFHGKSYRNLTKKLIDCNFGVDMDDLREEELQAAVYRTVITTLESLLEQENIAQPRKWT